MHLCEGFDLAGQTIEHWPGAEQKPAETEPGIARGTCNCFFRHSNQRVKGSGLRKNGNPYLSWAFHEAAHFAVRFQPDAKRWYEKKRSKTCPLVAIRALAHKLARAVYFMMRDQMPYEPKRLFG